RKRPSLKTGERRVSHGQGAGGLPGGARANHQAMITSLPHLFPCVTVRVVLPEMLPPVAAMAVVPRAWPVASPADVIVASAELDDDHVTDEVTLAVLPSL